MTAAPEAKKIRQAIKEATVRQADMLGLRPAMRQLGDGERYVMIRVEWEWKWFNVPAEWKDRIVVTAMCNCFYKLGLEYFERRGERPPEVMPGAFTMRVVDLTRQSMYGVGVDRVWIGQCACNKVFCGYVGCEKSAEKEPAE